MSVLLIEIGNTALKAACSEGKLLRKTMRYQGEKIIDYITVKITESTVTRIAIGFLVFSGVEKSGAFLIINSVVISVFP